MWKHLKPLLFSRTLLLILLRRHNYNVFFVHENVFIAFLKNQNSHWTNSRGGHPSLLLVPTHPPLSSSSPPPQPPSYYQGKISSRHFLQVSNGRTAKDQRSCIWQSFPPIQPAIAAQCNLVDWQSKQIAKNLCWNLVHLLSGKWSTNEPFCKVQIFNHLRPLLKPSLQYFPRYEEIRPGFHFAIWPHDMISCNANLSTKSSNTALLSWIWQEIQIQLCFSLWFEFIDWCNLNILHNTFGKCQKKLSQPTEATYNIIIN